MKVFAFTPGWLDKVEPGKPFTMKRGVQLKDQTSQKKLREEGILYTVKQVAEKLQVSEDSVREWVGTKKLGCFYVGRHIRISERHLEQFLGLKSAS